MLIWIAALLVMVWLVVRSPSERSTAEDAMAILRARFARGEISQEEFERAKAVLLADRQELTR
jgi:putative membrane protein